MKKKLVVRIDKEKIIEIKTYAKQQGFTVSQLVEEFIDEIEEEPKVKKLNIAKLKAAFKKAPKNFNRKEENTEIF